jgi:hypothetical protein
MIDDAEARATEMSSTLFLELTTLLVFWLCVSVMQRNFQAEPRRLFVALTLACGAWCVGDICYRSELLAPIAVHRISFLGVFAFPPLWLGLAAHTADARRAKRYWWLPLALLVPCAAAYGLLYVDSLTHLVLELTEDGGTAMGPVMWIAAFYLWTLTGLGGALFILAALRMRGPGQQLRRAGVIVAAVLPLAVDVAFVGLDLGWTDRAPHAPSRPDPDHRSTRNRGRGQSGRARAPRSGRPPDAVARRRGCARGGFRRAGCRDLAARVRRSRSGPARTARPDVEDRSAPSPR